MKFQFQNFDLLILTIFSIFLSKFTLFHTTSSDHVYGNCEIKFGFYLDALVDDNIDSLDGLLIREEEDDSSSDELDSQGSMNEMITHQPTQPAPFPQPPLPPSNQTKLLYPNHQKGLGSNQPKQSSKQKLLERRVVGGGGGHNNYHQTGNKANKKLSHQLSNASIKTSPTYPQNHHNNNNSTNKITTKNERTNLISFHQVGDDFEDDPLVGKAGIIADNNVPCANNSSSSSSTSSQHLSTTALSGPKEDLLHLSNTCEDEIVVLGK